MFSLQSQHVGQVRGVFEGRGCSYVTLSMPLFRSPVPVVSLKTLLSAGKGTMRYSWVNTPQPHLDDGLAKSGTAFCDLRIVRQLLEELKRLVHVRLGWNET